MTKKIIKSLGQCVELAVKARDLKEYDAKFNVEINEETWNVYEVVISNRDISITCNQGYAEYLVDSYGDDHFAVLHNWENE